MIAKSRQARRAGERQSRHRDSSVVDVQSQIWGSTDSPAWTPKSKTESLGVVAIVGTNKTTRHSTSQNKTEKTFVRLSA